jgi:gamma-polyglutamate biosynthesis protein CapC
MSPEEVVQLFPERGLAQSLHFAILVGVIVQLLLTEWFGWVFSGLPVPGYLASVFVFRPVAGVVMLVEALVTFVIVRWLSERFSRTGASSQLFGRERFFMIVLVSVLVRQHSELYALPLVGRLIAEHTGGEVRLESDLFGIGLVAVALLANKF